MSVVFACPGSVSPFPNHGCLLLKGTIQITRMRLALHLHIMGGTSNSRITNNALSLYALVMGQGRGSVCSGATMLRGQEPGVPRVLHTGQKSWKDRSNDHLNHYNFHFCLVLIFMFFEFYGMLI